MYFDCFWVSFISVLAGSLEFFSVLISVNQFLIFIFPNNSISQYERLAFLKIERIVMVQIAKFYA